MFMNILFMNINSCMVPGTWYHKIKIIKIKQQEEWPHRRMYHTLHVHTCQVLSTFSFKKKKTTIKYLHHIKVHGTIFKSTFVPSTCFYTRVHTLSLFLSFLFTSVQSHCPFFLKFHEVNATPPVSLPFVFLHQLG